MGGGRMAVVGAYRPVSQTYWRLWVDEGSGRVHRLEMVGPAHFMTAVFEGIKPAAPGGAVGLRGDASGGE